MKIASSDMAMTASHESWQLRETDTRMSAWADPTSGPGGERAGFSIDFREQTRVEVSEAGRSLLAASHRQTPATATPPASQDAVATGTDAACKADAVEAGSELSPQLRLLRDLVETLTGREVRFMSSAELAGKTPDTAAEPPPAAAESAPDGAPAARLGWGIEFDYREVNESYERSDFAAAGKVTLGDGRSLQFNFAMSMERYQRDEVSISIRAGDQRAKDPLILSLDGAAPSATGESFRFDLIAGGSTECLPVLRGSAYLALDANQNGRVDNGSELFGPSTNEGFAELAQLDQDQNGWIDEADAGFTKLRLWRPDANGNGSLQSLAEAGVGALYLGRVETPFTLKDGNGADVGAVRTSGIYLKESGEVAAMQQIDVAA